MHAAQTSLVRERGSPEEGRRYYKTILGSVGNAVVRPCSGTPKRIDFYYVVALAA